MHRILLIVAVAALCLAPHGESADTIDGFIATHDVAGLKDFVAKHPEAVEAVNKSGDDVLISAAAAGKADVVKVLLDAGVSPDLRADDKLQTPLYVSAIRNRLEVVKHLLAAGADPNLGWGGSGGGAVHAAIATDRNIECLKLILAQRNAEGEPIADVNFVDNKGMTPLLIAATYGKAPKSVLLLLEAGATHDWELVRNDQILHLCAKWGNTDAMTYLLDKGMDIEIAGRFGRGRPLLTAIKAGQLEAVKLLLDRGAKVDDAAMLLAEKGKSAEIVALLNEHTK